MLRIAEHFHATDTGRQRQGNEDSYFVRSPLFVVADGMGGAQSGEVASAMAVGSFEPGLPTGDPPEALVAVIERANRDIHDRSRAETHRAGMGTTVTAAYVGEHEVTVAHVGDSRAYLMRDGDLVRLTRDHSLVEELVARGKLTEEQAETHPQRSVITRALGPEPRVEVDVDVFPAKAGDLFLLCSDGLTSMIGEAHVKELLRAAQSLEDGGRTLIGAANEAGGRDNITVVLFRLEEVETADTVAPHDDATREHVAPADVETKEVPAVAAAADAGAVAVAPPQAQTAAGTNIEVPSRTHRLPDGTQPGEPVPPPPPQPAPRRRRRRARRLTIFAVVTLGLLFPILAGGWIATRAVYFVGTAEDGRTITIFRGLPYELPFGIKLYEEEARSGMTLEQVPASRRATFTDHRLRSNDDAVDLVNALERGQLSS